MHNHYFLFICSILFFVAGSLHAQHRDVNILYDDPEYAQFFAQAGVSAGNPMDWALNYEAELDITPFDFPVAFNLNVQNEIYGFRMRKYNQAKDDEIVRTQKGYKPFQSFGGGVTFMIGDKRKRENVSFRITSRITNNKFTQKMKVHKRKFWGFRVGAQYYQYSLTPENTGNNVIESENRTLANDTSNQYYTQTSQIVGHAGVSYNIIQGALLKVDGDRMVNKFKKFSAYADLLYSYSSSIDPFLLDEGNEISGTAGSGGSSYQLTPFGTRAGFKIVYGQDFNMYLKIEGVLLPGYQKLQPYGSIGTGVSYNF